MPEVLIRPYNTKDRQRVRFICCQTADKGNPCESFFDDREVLADIVTLYYTDFDSSAVWVSEVNGEIVGYLMGCFNTQKCNQVSSFKIMPRLIFKALLRGVFLSPKTYHMIHGALKSLFLGGFKRNISLSKYPAHLHIDILAEFRGLRIGRQLMDKFLVQAKENNVLGVHLSTREDNKTATQFFQRVGFSVLGRFPMAMPEGKKFVITNTVIYGKSI